MCLRGEVLSFYKQTIRLSKSWKAINDWNTPTERQYITTEAKRLITQNRDLTDEQQIRKLLNEGIERLEIARHYRIPYPRPVYYPTGAYIRKHK